MPTPRPALAWPIPLAVSVGAFVLLCNGGLRSPRAAAPAAVPAFGQAEPDDPTCRQSAGCLAGYQWAADRGINEPGRCPKRNGAFRRGCLVLLAEVAQDAEVDALSHTLPNWGQR